MTSAAVTPASKAEGKTSLDPMYQIEAGLLNVGDAEAGPADGPAVVLLHGWSYDIQSYVDVAPLLAAKGYRVIVPYLCGYGTTHFPSDETFRNGQQSTLAVDTVALMDALEIEKAIVAGFDWGARSCRLRQIPARQSRMPPLTPTTSSASSSSPPSPQRQASDSARWRAPRRTTS